MASFPISLLWGASASAFWHVLQWAVTLTWHFTWVLGIRILFSHLSSKCSNHWEIFPAPNCFTVGTLMWPQCREQSRIQLLFSRNWPALAGLVCFSVDSTQWHPRVEGTDNQKVWLICHKRSHKFSYEYASVELCGCYTATNVYACACFKISLFFLYF